VGAVYSTAWLGIACGLAVGLASGLLVGWSRLRRSRRQAAALRAELDRTVQQSREQTRMVARMRGEQGTVASLVRVLPTIVRELNRSDLDPRRVPPLVLQLATALFEPERLALYLVRSPGFEGSHPRELYLKEHRGLVRVSPSIERIQSGEGRIGWVAENRVEMTTEDWPNLARNEGVAVEDRHPAINADLIGPLVHHSLKGEEVLGVLCIGSPKSRRSDEKLMLQMVTNLASIALMNARNLTRLRDQAQHDGLTGLLNKKQFMKDLGLLINGAEREASSLGVFIFDIDFFKRYNDSHGHLAGDELLKTISTVLRENIRPGDLACRYGGEEFVVALPETPGERALVVAEKIRAAIEAFPFAQENSQPGGSLTISGGVAAFPEDGTNGTELISHADQALYQAKAEGRNRVIRYLSVNIGDLDDDEAEDLGAWSTPGFAGER